MGGAAGPGGHRDRHHADGGRARAADAVGVGGVGRDLSGAARRPASRRAGAGQLPGRHGGEHRRVDRRAGPPAAAPAGGLPAVVLVAGPRQLGADRGQRGRDSAGGGFDRGRRRGGRDPGHRHGPAGGFGGVARSARARRPPAAHGRSSAVESDSNGGSASAADVALTVQRWFGHRANVPACAVAQPAKSCGGRPRTSPTVGSTGDSSSSPST